MENIPESTLNLFLSLLMGIIGGLITIPINALLAYWLKRDELLYKHKLDMIAKQRELLLQHKMELELLERDDEINKLKALASKLNRDGIK